MNTTPATLLGAAHYWHARYAATRRWRLIALFGVVSAAAGWCAWAVEAWF